METLANMNKIGGGMGIDTSRLITTVDANYSSSGLSYTCTEDCWVIAELEAKATDGVLLYIDGVVVMKLLAERGSNNTNREIIGLPIFCREGQVITSRKGYTNMSARITVYGLK